MNEKECFAYKNGKCKALKVTHCEGDGCRFYKTKEQLDEAQEKVFKRIRSLDAETGSSIINQYCGGKLKLLDESEVI